MLLYAVWANGVCGTLVRRFGRGDRADPLKLLLSNLFRCSFFLLEFSVSAVPFDSRAHLFLVGPFHRVGRRGRRRRHHNRYIVVFFFFCVFSKIDNRKYK